jgi:hypothetical protein
MNKNKPASEVRYDADSAALVCERIATTPQSLVEICEAPDMPGIATVFRWLRDHPEFREMYVIAKQEQVEILMDECFQIVDDTSKDAIVTDDGRTILNPVNVQRARLQVNFRMWIASKLHPRKYGNIAASRPPEPPASPVTPDGDPIVTKEVLLYLQASRRKAVERRLREKEANPSLAQSHEKSAHEQQEADRRGGG